MGDEGHFPLVSILDVDVVVSPSDIKLGEDPGILDGVGVDVSVILAGSEGVRGILFVNEEEGGCLRGV